MVGHQKHDHRVHLIVELSSKTTGFIFTSFKNVSFEASDKRTWIVYVEEFKGT